jgi:hypothetical protein
VPPTPLTCNPPASDVTDLSAIAWSQTDFGGLQVTDGSLEQAVLAMSDEARPENTRIACDGKIAKCFLFCDSVCPDDSFKNTLGKQKVWVFAFCQSMRTQRKRGGGKNRAETARFVKLDYDQVMAECHGWFGDQSQAPPEPTDPVGTSVLAQCKAAIRQTFKEQVAANLLGSSWDQIWTMRLENLQNLVKSRRSISNKKAHVEKLDHEFSPCTTVEEHPKIEAEMWERGNAANTRSSHAWMQHRFCCLLFSTSGILRGESLCKAELSNFLSLRMKKGTDPHHLMVMIMQIATGECLCNVSLSPNEKSNVQMQTHTMDTGETNNGQKLCGRSMRHKEVELCSVGGLAFCLAMRFDLTKEFEEFDLDNFLENEKWFDIKLLTDATRSDHDHTKAMANDSCAKTIKSVSGKLGLVSNHWVHLGRTIGPKLLEFPEIKAQEIRILGNWEAKMPECSCSAKPPMKAVRAANGFFQANGMHFNPRTVVEGPEFERLKRLNPFAWACEAVEFFEEPFARLGVEGHHTAFHFVKFMASLNTVFLQDATAMLIKFPERCHCAMCNMPVFQHADFELSSIFCVCFAFVMFFADPSLLLLPQTYAATMRQSMSHEESPMDHSIESVLPGVHSRLSAMQINMAEGFRVSNHEMKEQEKRGIQREEQRELREIARVEENNKRLATVFRNAADGMMMTGSERETEGAVDGGDDELRTDRCNCRR